MNKREDFGKYLHDHYPELFSKELYPECGIGWFDIIDDLSRQISAYVKALPTQTQRYAEVVQIKEKFGGLRYYVQYHNLTDNQIQEIESLIRVAESRTAVTCEDCGDDGSMVSPRKYWMRTLCGACINNYDMGDTPNGI